MSTHGNLEVLDPMTEALLGLAGAIATGDETVLEGRSRAACMAEVAPDWVEELLLQSVLMVGYPRALVAAAVWRRVSQLEPPPVDRDAANAANWSVRGEATCRAIYRGNYERLRENVRRLHPALDEWMVHEGYGRVIGREGLDLARRELCTVVQLTILRSPRQLHSHLRGALQVGAGPAAVDGALRIAALDALPEAAVEADNLWSEVRKAGRAT